MKAYTRPPLSVASSQKVTALQAPHTILLWCCMRHAPSGAIRELLQHQLSCCFCVTSLAAVQGRFLQVPAVREWLGLRPSTFAQLASSDSAAIHLLAQQAPPGTPSPSQAPGHVQPPARLPGSSPPSRDALRRMAMPDVYALVSLMPVSFAASARAWCPSMETPGLKCAGEHASRIDGTR